MSAFYEAFERERNSDIKHHGVKGMRWGQRNPKVYVPVSERREVDDYQDYNRPPANVPREDVDGAVENVQNSNKERVKEIAKEIAKQIAIQAGAKLIIGGLIGGGMLIKKKLGKRTTFGSTPEGEALRQKVEGAAKT